MGMSSYLLSDRSTEFISQVSTAVFETLGAVKKFTSSYHPQINGMVERLNHTLCQMLSYLIADDQKKFATARKCGRVLNAAGQICFALTNHRALFALHRSAPIVSKLHFALH